MEKAFFSKIELLSPKYRGLSLFMHTIRIFSADNEKY